MASINFLNLFQHPKKLVDLSPKDLEQKLKENPRCILIDVRTSSEYQSGHIKGAKLYPLGNEAKIAHDFKVDEDIILICRSGHRSQAAAKILLKHRFEHLSHLKGGMNAWIAADKPIKK